MPNEVKLLPSDLELLEAVTRAIDDALPESDRLTLAPSQIRRAAKAAIEAMSRPTTVVAGEPQDLGVPASPSGHSRAEPEEVSALRASVPNAVTRAIKRLSPAQKSAVLSLSFERPRLLNHRESVSVLVMERVELEPCVFAQLTKHSYASEGWRSTPTGQLTDLGEAVRCRLASAIEARRAATPESGAVHESATAASGDAQ